MSRFEHIPGHEKDYVPDAYDTQGMGVKLAKHDEEIKKHKTFTYPCESHLTWCCGGSQDLDEQPDIAALYPYTLASEAQRRDLAATRFDAKTGACLAKGVFRVVILDREEEMSTKLARVMQPTLCEECCQLAIYERIFREILSTQQADQMEAEYAITLEKEAKKNQNKRVK